MLWLALLGLYGPASFALGYYVSHRGILGVKSDVTDIKTDVVKVENEVKSVVAPTA